MIDVIGIIFNIYYCMLILEIFCIILYGILDEGVLRVCWFYFVPVYGFILALKDIKEHRYFRKTIKWSEY